MKKLIKSEVCGTREQCTSALFMGEKSKVLAKKQKKKKMKHVLHPDMDTNIVPKRVLNLLVNYWGLYQKSYNSVCNII